MNNTIKLLLFNILLFSAPALQAMGSVRTFGARAFKVASASAAKFKVNAQVFKAMKSPQVQYLKSFTAVGFGLGLASFLYKDHLKNAFNEEVQVKDCAICSNSLADRKDNNICKKCAKIKMVYEKIKKLVGVDDKIGFTVQPGLNNAYAALDILITIGEEFMDGDPLVRDFVLGHELTHIKNRHTYMRCHYETKLIAEQFEKQGACYDETVNAMTTWDYFFNSDIAAQKCINKALKESEEKLFAKRRSHECEADEGAALALGTIEGGMRLFGAIPDKNSPHGWQLPADRTNEEDLKDVHPSHANRCRALLALVEKYPSKFPKPFVDRINSLNP